MEKELDWVDRVKLRLKQGDINVDYLAECIGVTPANIRHYLNRRRIPPFGKMEEIARAIGLTFEQLLFGEEKDILSDDPCKIPLFSWDSIHKSDNKIKVTSPVYVSKKSYALKVQDDSMRNLYEASPTFPVGTIIIVDPNKEYSNGKYILACEKGDKSKTPIFRKYMSSTAGNKLQPLNPLYDKEDASNFEILGVVVASMNLDL